MRLGSFFRRAAGFAGGACLPTSARLFRLFTGLQLRGAYGDDAAWYFFALVSVAAAAAGAVAVRGAAHRRVVPAAAA